jgi:hypothetical protein
MGERLAFRYRRGGDDIAVDFHTGGDETRTGLRRRLIKRRDVLTTS